MEKWGASLYGNPCRDCGFEWDLSVAQAVVVVREIPDRYAHLLAGAGGGERHPDLGWSATGYVSHVADNLRSWAERLVGGYLAGDLTVPGYDPDLLSEARRYNELSLAGACGRCAGPSTLGGVGAEGGRGRGCPASCFARCAER